MKNFQITNKITFLEIIKILNKNRIFILSIVSIFFIVFFIYSKKFYLESYRTTATLNTTSEIDITGSEKFKMLFTGEEALHKIYYNQLIKNISSSENFISFLNDQNQTKSINNFKEMLKSNNLTIETYFFDNSSIFNANEKFGLIIEKSRSETKESFLYLVYPKKFLDGPAILNEYILFSEKKTQADIYLFLKNKLQNYILESEKLIKIKKNTIKEIATASIISTINLDLDTKLNLKKYIDLETLEVNNSSAKESLDFLNKKNLVITSIIAKKAYSPSVSDNKSNLFIIFTGSFCGFLLSILIILIKNKII